MIIIFKRLIVVTSIVLFSVTSLKANDSKEIFIPNNKDIRGYFKLKGLSRLYKEDKEKVLNFRKKFDKHIQITDGFLSGKIVSNCKNVREQKEFLIPPYNSRLAYIKNIEEAMSTVKKILDTIIYQLYKNKWKKFGDEYEERCGGEKIAFYHDEKITLMESN